MATHAELTTHIDRIGLIIRNAHLKRSLHRFNANPTLNFWRCIYGNLLDVAVLEWCKVFGSKKEPTHWEKVVPKEDHEQFCAGLLDAVGIDQDE